MGLFKAFLFFTTGAVRPTTTRERSRIYQRRANNLLEDQLDALQGLSIQGGGQVDSRLRAPCPACLELILVGASMCPHCKSSGFTWPESPPSITKPAPIQSVSTEKYSDAKNQPLSAAHLRHLNSFKKDVGKKEAMEKLALSFEELGDHVQLVLNPSTNEPPSEQFLRLHFLKAEQATSELKRFDKLKSKKHREILVSLAKDVEAKIGLKDLLAQTPD